MGFLKEEKYFWLISLLTVMVHANCPQIEKCLCTLNSGADYEMYCEAANNSAFILTIKPDDYVSVQCTDDPSWSDFNFNLTLNPISSIYFRLCKLPSDFGLGVLASKLNAMDASTLLFQSNGNFTDGFKKFHLSGLSNLKKLILSSNNFCSLPADLFDDLSKLEWLDLRDNNIQFLPVDIFRQTFALNLLELGTNKLSHIQAETFANLTKLKLLNIWGNSLTQLNGNTFDNLVSLKVLDISRNFLETLPAEIFTKSGNLTVLNLRGNNFTFLPAGLFRKNVNLQSVNLSQNRKNLTTIPSEFFANLISLKNVKLSRDGLEYLPENIFHGALSLEFIELSYNFLTSLPKNVFEGLSNLKTLKLDFNRLASLPDGIFSSASSLSQLDLSHNRILTVSSGLFVGLGALHELNMNNNGLNELHAKSLQHLKSLKIGRFANNNLTLKTRALNVHENWSPFHNCLHLTELYLANNSINEIFSDWITNSLRLRRLDLRYNNISQVMAKDLRFTSNVIDVMLSHNQIRHILLAQAETFAMESPAGRAVNILLGENPLVCDCEVYHLLRNLEGKMGQFVADMFTLNVEKLRCHQPEELMGFSVQEFHSNTFTCMLKNMTSKDICPIGCQCRFQPAKFAYLFDCSYRNFRELYINVSPSILYSIEINLRGNQLTQMPQIVAQNVSKIFLSDNKISDISFQKLLVFKSTLEVLEIHNNNLTLLTSENIGLLRNFSSLKHLSLHGNPWICDCSLKDFLGFVQTTKLLENEKKSKITCGNGSVMIYELTAIEICSTGIEIFIGISVTVAFLGIAMGIAAALYYRYQQEIKVWLYAHRWCLWFVTEEELDKNKLYDAFVSYSHKDEEFILNELQPGLESGPRPFKLCLHFRDWLAGEWIPTQIARSVDESRRTIIVLSPNFLESIWGRMEFRAAHNQALSEGRARVIVILYGDIGSTEKLDPELKTYLSMNTYIKWGDPWFWEKLRYALPHPPELTKHTVRKWKIFEQDPSIEGSRQNKQVSCTPRY